MLSTIAHLSSVVVLFMLTTTLYPGHGGSELALRAAVLHVISQAGVFLSAPCAESVFSLFNFLGMLFYAKAHIQHSAIRSQRGLFVLVSGLCFGSATLFRSNGLLSGLIFLWDVLVSLPLLIRNPFDGLLIRRVVITGLAGLLSLMGLVIPQFIAYQQYCFGSDPRPWCHRLPPSIYSWVQEHYWNVGFLRYWTISNIPLFLLAAPTVYLMLRSLHEIFLTTNGSQSSPETRALIQRFAIPQVLLVVLALTSFHVQILNRISSGYPLLYIGLAQSSSSRWATHWLVVYAVVQGGLYASFLPPA